MKFFILFSLLFFSTLLPILGQRKAEPRGKGESSGLEGLSMTGLPFLAYNDDRGVIYGARVVGTYYQKKSKPYHYQFWFQHIESSLRYTDHAGYFDYISLSGLRWRIRMGKKRDFLARYYGYGNYQDIPRIRSITGDQGPVIPVGPNLIRSQFDPDFNAERIKDSQNRYYNYAYDKSYIDTSLEDWFGESHFKYFIGFLGQAYSVHSYHGVLDAGEVETNILSYVDLERPVGYDAIHESRRKYVNYLRAALAYDSRPPKYEKNPYTGIFTDIHYESASEAIGSDYEYSNLTLTWRQYVNLFPSFWKALSMRNVFAYRFMLRETLDGTAPFFEAGKVRNIRERAEGLGGKNGLRGFHSNQFIDKFLLLGNFEIRHTYLQSKILGGVDFYFLYFYDLGRVAPSSREFLPKDFHKSYGFGFGAVWEGNLVAQASFGYSKFQTYTSFGMHYTF